MAARRSQACLFVGAGIKGTQSILSRRWIRSWVLNTSAVVVPRLNDMNSLVADEVDQTVFAVDPA